MYFMKYDLLFHWRQIKKSRQEIKSYLLNPPQRADAKWNLPKFRRPEEINDRVGAPLVQSRIFYLLCGRTIRKRRLTVRVAETVRWKCFLVHPGRLLEDGFRLLHASLRHEPHQRFGYSPLKRATQIVPSRLVRPHNYRNTYTTVALYQMLVHWELNPGCLSIWASEHHSFKPPNVLVCPDVLSLFVDLYLLLAYFWDIFWQPHFVGFWSF